MVVGGTELVETTVDVEDDVEETIVGVAGAGQRRYTRRARITSRTARAAMILRRLSFPSPPDSEATFKRQCCGGSGVLKSASKGSFA
jgi:hypothetical protein